MRIAIIGAGISGLTAADQLHRDHEIVVFEAAKRIGGHTRTVDVEWAGRSYAIDTGFIVCNDWTYPNFLDLLARLGVATQPSTMSFSVRCERTGLEYNGSTLNSLFGQRRNLLRPSFHRMVLDILRFNREAPRLIELHPDTDMTLGEYLEQGGFSEVFVKYYLQPMGAAIWSTQPARMLECPAAFFIRFFRNHGMLSVDARPQWRVVRGGSRTYVERMTAAFRDRIRISAAVHGVRSVAGGVEVESACGARERFDAAFLACHSDEALRLLKDATPAEREVLGAIRYQRNDVVLHTDERLLPRRSRCRAAWNYHVMADAGTDDARSPVAVTYDMNALQSLDAPVRFCVTLNRTQDIDPAAVLGRYIYHHPLFTRESVTAQARHAEINGARGLYYCGAYWRYGFHEDGVVSALRAVRDFRERQAHAQLSLRRLG